MSGSWVSRWWDQDQEYTSIIKLTRCVCSAFYWKAILLRYFMYEMSVVSITYMVKKKVCCYWATADWTRWWLLKQSFTHCHCRLFTSLYCLTLCIIVLLTCLTSSSWFVHVFTWLFSSFIKPLPDRLNLSHWPTCSMAF